MFHYLSVPAKVVDVRGHEVIGRKELEAFNLDGVSCLSLRSLDRADSSFPERYPILKEDIGPFLKKKDPSDWYGMSFRRSSG